MKKLIIITGANKGLGKAFHDLFIEKGNCIVVSISRRLSPDQQHLIDNGNKQFVFIQTDLSQLKNSSSLKQLDQFVETVDSTILISNAGIVGPINSIGMLNDEELLNSVYVNAISPAIIINYVIKLFSNKKLDILHISSGAAQKVIEGWATYCSGKAYMQMFINALQSQVKDNALITVHNINPGLIDTQMQQDIRNSNTEGFSRYADFVRFKNEGKLQDAAIVAANILTETNTIL